MTRTLAALWLPLLLWTPHPSHAASPCPMPKRVFVVETLLGEAEIAYSEGNSERFESSTSHALSALRCVTDEVTPNLAAKLHRVVGLQAHQAGRYDEAARAFAAARVSDTKFTFTEDMLPGEHPVRELYFSLRLADAEFESVSIPDGLRVQLDGREVRTRVTSWPTVLQIFDGEGVTETVFLRPGDVLPARLIRVVETGSGTAVVGESTPTGGVRTALQVLAPAVPAVGGVVLGVLSGSSYSRARKGYREYETAYPDLANEPAYAALDQHYAEEVQRPRNIALIEATGAAILLGTAVGVGFATRASVEVHPNGFSVRVGW